MSEEITELMLEDLRESTMSGQVMSFTNVPLFLAAEVKGVWSAEGLIALSVLSTELGNFNPNEPNFPNCLPSAAAARPEPPALASPGFFWKRLKELEVWSCL